MRSSHVSFTLVLAVSGIVACNQEPRTGPRSRATAQAIQGGKVEEGYPSTGLLEFQSGNFGTGTLIGKRVILTAGHVTGGNITGFYTGQGIAIAPGPNTASSDTMTKHAVAEKLMYPGYQCESRCRAEAARDAGLEAGLPDGGAASCAAACASYANLDIDVGLVLLTDPAADLAPVRFGAKPKKGATCITVGYGLHVPDWNAPSPVVKQKRSAENKITFVASDSFASEWITGVADGGDSGGPFFCEGSLVGTTAFHSDGDGPEHREEWYARTDVVMPWIETMFRQWGETWPPPQNAESEPAPEPEPEPELPAPSTPAPADEDGGCQLSPDPSGYGWMAPGALAALAIVVLRRRPVRRRS